MKPIIVLKSRDHATHPTTIQIAEEEGKRYLLSLETKIALEEGEDPQKVIWEAAAEIASVSEFPTLEQCRWGIIDPTDIEREVKDKCFVLIHRFFLNGETMTYLEEEGRGTPRKFASREEAESWITAEEGEPYILSHNETSRPAYYIVPAE